MQRQLFDINQYPETALIAPITDMTYMFLKKDKTFEGDLHPILTKFTQLEGTGAKGAYWGQTTKHDGVSIILIGWDSVQVNFFKITFSKVLMAHAHLQEHYDAGKLPAYRELNDSAVPVVTFNLKHVDFEKIF